MATWSAIRDKLENEYLAESLRGHIRYFATTYRESHDQEGRAAIYYDGQEVIAGGYYHRDFCIEWYPKIETDEVIRKGAFDQASFYAAFHDFDNQSIEESLKSSNLLIRIFALLDRRVGKRRLLAIKEQMPQEPETVQTFYRIRMEAERLCGERS